MAGYDVMSTLAQMLQANPQLLQQLMGGMQLAPPTPTSGTTAWGPTMPGQTVLPSDSGGYGMPQRRGPQLNPWSTGYPNMGPQMQGMGQNPMQSMGQNVGRAQLPQLPQQRGMYGLPSNIGTPGMAMQSRAPLGMMGGPQNVGVPGRNVGASFGGSAVNAQMGNPRMVGQTVNSRGPFLGGMLEELPYRR